MRALILGLFLTVSLLACKAPVEEVDIKQELTDGGWRFSSIMDVRDLVVVSGEGPPRVLFFCYTDQSIRGLFEGHYNYLDGQLYLEARIDSTYEGTIYTGSGDLLRLPQRLVEVDALLKYGIEGPVTFYENGWDSQISIHYAPERWLWLERY